MKIGKYGKIILNPDELKYIRDNWDKKTAQEVADHLGLKRTKVREFAYAMGCKKIEMEYWTREQITFLRENYRTIGDSELAEIFTEKWHKEKGWTKKHIEKKRRYLKLKRTKAEKEKIHERNVETGRFSMCPVKAWEVRGITDPGEVRVWKHQDGSEFKVIRLADGFVHYNRWLWEKYKGPIPDGLVVRTKNDNPLDSRIENLELISRSEHARRNSLMRYPEPLRETIKMTRKLEKQLNEQNNG